MRLHLSRIYGDTNVTLGVLRTPTMTLATCEDAIRPQKIKGITCIPCGTYDIILRKKSGMASAYRDRYGEAHEGMLWLQDVPGFEYIYIHTGNTVLDTDGCILVGDSMSLVRGTIGQSRDAYARLYPQIMDALGRGEHVEITVADIHV